MIKKTFCLLFTQSSNPTTLGCEICWRFIISLLTLCNLYHSWVSIFSYSLIANALWVFLLIARCTFENDPFPIWDIIENCPRTSGFDNRSLKKLLFSVFSLTVLKKLVAVLSDGLLLEIGAFLVLSLESKSFYNLILTLGRLVIGLRNGALRDWLEGSVDFLLSRINNWYTWVFLKHNDFSYSAL